jgi:uncharacterized protein (DUF58 family)
VQLHPTRATFHVALAGAAMVAVGLAARVAPVVAWGGAIVLAVAIGRAIALATVTRLRSSGFEMVWNASRRVVRLARGGEIVLEAELRNRGVDDARGVALRAVASSMLSVRIEPPVLDLPSGSRVRVDVHVRAKRVGRWGVHGMALEVRGTPAGGEGLYEVPLMFANPFGVEVLPRTLHALIANPRGGRSRRAAEAGRPSSLAGDGDELRELREHVPGDPFKRIAWKASAKRGQLVVREMERDERDIVWLVMDASVELWAGAEGKAPLDDGVDEVAALASRHLARGDHVGLVVTASRLRTWIAPASGAAHAVRLAAALASAASMVDSDRCELDEWEIAQRVAEHARPLDPRGLADIPKGNLDQLAARGESLRARAPFAPRLPYAKGAREQRLRHYLASFGVEVPPRLDGEREKADVALATVLDKLSTEKQRASIVHVWAPAPLKKEATARALRKLRARRAVVRWTVPLFDRSVGPKGEEEAFKAADPLFEAEATNVEGAVQDAVRIRSRAARVRAERGLRQIGARPQNVERRGPALAQAVPQGPEAPAPPSGKA